MVESFLGKFFSGKPVSLPYFKSGWQEEIIRWKLLPSGASEEVI